jgi:putative PIN family toxin of toxin-antitoxin system
MLRVVFDTVVFVRALLNQNSVCGRLVFGHMERYQLCLSTPLVIEILQVLARDELVGKLERRRGAYVHIVAGLLESFQRAMAVEISSIPAISRDPKDDKVLATASAAGADYLVSEDQDLLVLDSHEGTRIVNAITFLRILEQQDS